MILWRLSAARRLFSPYDPVCSWVIAAPHHSTVDDAWRRSWSIPRCTHPAPLSCPIWSGTAAVLFVLLALVLTEHQSQKQQEQQNYRSVIKAESLTPGALGLTLPLKWSVVEENGGSGRTRHRPVPTTSRTSTRNAQGSAATAARGSQATSDRLDDRGVSSKRQSGDQRSSRRSGREQQEAVRRPAIVSTIARRKQMGTGCRSPGSTATRSTRRDD